MDVVLWIATGAVAFFGFITVHELGHALAARLIGVPSDDVAVRLTQWPAHVALRSHDHQWHSPGTVDYQDAYARHDPELRWLGSFVAAGFVLQATTMAVIVAGSVSVGFDDFGSRLVRVSMVVNGLYLVGDLVATIVARAPAGDMSSLLRHAPRAGAATLVILIGTHATAWLIA